MLLKNEKVESICEFAINRLVLGIFPRDLIVTQNWQVAHIIKDQNLANSLKHWISPLPGFDKDSFPFLLCSGRKSFNLVNVKNRSMQVLIDSPAVHHNGQTAAFFKAESKNGFSINFAH